MKRKIEFWMYDIILFPVITEKATRCMENQQYTFRVAKNVNKLQVKRAIEGIFGVTVKAVNILNVKGKVKKFRGVLGRRIDVKKAIVSLELGQEIDFSVGVK